MRPLRGLLDHLPLDNANCNQRSTSCIQSAHTAFGCALSDLGFRYGRFTFWREDRDNRDRPLATYSYSYSNFPAEWEASYQEASLFQNDPVLVASRGKPDERRLVRYGTWRDAYRHSLGTTRSRIRRKQLGESFELAERFDVHDGIFFAYGGPYDAIFLSGANPGTDALPALTDDLWKSFYGMVVLLECVISRTIQCNLCAKEISIHGHQRENLTPRQLEILRFFINHSHATAKSTAQQLRITPGAVNFHLKTLRKKFDRPRASGHALAKIAQDLRLI